MKKPLTCDFQTQSQAGATHGAPVGDACVAPISPGWVFFSFFPQTSKKVWNFTAVAFLKQSSALAQTPESLGL